MDYATVRLPIKQKSRYKLQWKKNLKRVGDNANYIELNIYAITKELKKNNPDTKYLRSKVNSINEWLGEIDLARERANKNFKLRRIV